MSCLNPVTKVIFDLELETNILLSSKPFIQVIIELRVKWPLQIGFQI